MPSVWQERGLRVRRAVVSVAPHAWERAAGDIMRALGGEGTVVRGHARPADENRPPPTFNRVWSMREAWRTWVVSHDGTVYDPMAVWPELDPHAADPSGRFAPFDDVIQNVLAKKIPTSWTYVANLLCRMSFHAACRRPLDDTESKDFGDILMLPILDRVSVTPVSAIPLPGGGLVATRDIRKGEFVAAFPVDAVMQHSAFIREYACPRATANRFRYPLSARDAAALLDAETRLRGSSVSDLMVGATALGETSQLVAVSLRRPAADTLYNGHAAREGDGASNATKVIVRDGGVTLGIISFAEADIHVGEEIVMRADTATRRLAEVSDAHTDAFDAAPRQEVYAFTDIRAVVEMKVL
eukprot:jgi/Tetstr1/454134/TSEL_041053.t1